MIQLPEGYIERPMAPELDLVSRIHGRFKGSGFVMPKSQANIYRNLRDFFVDDVKNYRGYPKQIHKPTVCDVGCGCGVGANILSHEAQFVWGIDANEESIHYARQMFERESNNIYYTPQISFDIVDVTNEPRELKTFDYVVCIEVIEHIPRSASDGLIQFLNRLVKKNKGGGWVEDLSRTKIFLSTPNRNSPRIQKNTPFNEHHCFEPNAAEMYEYLTKKYKHVTVYDENFVLQELGTEATPLVYKLEIPL